MQYQPKRKPLPTKPDSLSNPAEKERVLMQYAGIFKHQIKEFAEVVIAKHKPIKNIAR